jgi:hypothetical protein
MLCKIPQHFFKKICNKILLGGFSVLYSLTLMNKSLECHSTYTNHKGKFRGVFLNFR